MSGGISITAGPEFPPRVICPRGVAFLTALIIQGCVGDFQILCREKLLLSCSTSNLVKKLLFRFETLNLLNSIRNRSIGSCYSSSYCQLNAMMMLCLLVRAGINNTVACTSPVTCCTGTWYDRTSFFVRPPVRYCVLPHALTVRGDLTGYPVPV